MGLKRDHAVNTRVQMSSYETFSSAQHLIIFFCDVDSDGYSCNFHEFSAKHLGTSYLGMAHLLIHFLCINIKQKSATAYKIDFSADSKGTQLPYYLKLALRRLALLHHWI